MISQNDTTILAVLSRYPDMPAEEANQHINKIEHEENIPICHAVLGRITENELEPDAKIVFQEFQRWSAARTGRIRAEQQTARRRNQETKLALKMNELHEKGIISDQALIMYGISGDLPEANMYNRLSLEEKNRLWAEKMEDRFGPHWRERFRNRGIPLITVRQLKPAKSEINWRKEGF